jgi:hypothetical protein
MKSSASQKRPSPLSPLSQLHLPLHASPLSPQYSLNSKSNASPSAYSPSSYSPASTATAVFSGSSPTVLGDRERYNNRRQSLNEGQSEIGVCFLLTQKISESISDLADSILILESALPYDLTCLSSNSSSLSPSLSISSSHSPSNSFTHSPSLLLRFTLSHNQNTMTRSASVENHAAVTSHKKFNSSLLVTTPRSALKSVCMHALTSLDLLWTLYQLQVQLTPLSTSRKNSPSSPLGSQHSQSHAYSPKRNSPLSPVSVNVTRRNADNSATITSLMVKIKDGIERLVQKLQQQPSSTAACVQDLDHHAHDYDELESFDVDEANLLEWDIRQLSGLLFAEPLGSSFASVSPSTASPSSANFADVHADTLMIMIEKQSSKISYYSLECLNYVKAKDFAQLVSHLKMLVRIVFLHSLFLFDKIVFLQYFKFTHLKK